MPIAVGDIVQIQARGFLHGQEVITSWWYRNIVPGSTIDTIVVLDELIDYFNISNNPPYLAYVACLPSDWTAGEVTAQQITPVRSVLRSKTSVPVAGGRGAGTTPNVGSTVTKGTNLAGRSQIGSWHLPGVATADMVGGYLQPALMLALGTFASKSLNVLTLPVTFSQWEPILIHIDPTGVTPPTGSLLTRAVPQETVRIMRRRTVGVGK